MAIFEKAGSWYVDYYVDGKRKREKVGPSKTLAREVLSKRLNEVADRKYFPERHLQGHPVPFAEFLEKYWERHWKRLSGKGGTSIKKSLLGAFGERTLDRIMPGAVQDYYNRKRDATSAATANRHLARIAHIFNSALKWKDYSGQNPADDVQKEREENHKTRFLSKDEIARLLAACSDRLYPVIFCALHAGMRRGEILGLRWENLTLDHGVIFVLKSKSGKPREIPLTPQLGALLRGFGARRQGPVFQIPAITVKRHFAKALEKAKIDDFRFHDLRHTFASHFVMSTGDLPALQRILGHSSLKMTMRYAHLSQAHLAGKMTTFAQGLLIGPGDS
ncbi:MAG: tyrosine-type recombinase/integrase [Elusimicrobia bacterium]|nr:tyrosine-type recombinase/integrase [Elusimicrobiota bacterium]